MKNGGPAFPSKQKALMIKSEHIGIASEYEIDTNGMTLRDYFAAKAMQGMIEAFGKSEGDTNIIPSGIASYAYGIADAMLKARKE